MIEIATFRLAPGADETDFLDADRHLQTDFAYQQPGLVRRTTARGSDGEWLVVTVWRSDADADEADAAARRAGDDAPTGRFASLIDAGTLRRSRYTTLD